MSEITKDFIKFIAEVFALLLIFSVIFSPQGVATNTLNYFVFAEPILLQNYIASAMTIGSQVKGDFYSDIKLTSGLPHTIKIFFQGGIPYISVTPAQEVFMRTTFAKNNPTPIMTTCSVSEGEIKLPAKAGTTVIVEKTIENNNCKLTLTLGAGVVSPSTSSNLPCDDVTQVVPNGECSLGDPPKYCDNGNLIDKCSQCGCPGGYVCTDSEECFNGGTLSVYAFANNAPIKANVAIGLGDVNWDGIVNDTDVWYYNTNNPNRCFGTSLGNPNWNIDCDMNLDNKIDMADIGIVNSQYDKTIPIKTTQFSMPLSAGAYALRAKYSDQIKNNNSVVITKGEKTIVDFNFP